MEEFVESLRQPSPLPRWLRWLRQLLPPLCWQCKKLLGGRTFLDPASPFLCTSCLLELPWTDQAYHCRQCGNHTAEPNRLRCQECIEDICRIDGAQLMPLSSFDPSTSGLDPEATIYLYCYKGKRSMLALKELKKTGFNKLKNLSGGIDLWAEEVDSDMPQY